MYRTILAVLTLLLGLVLGGGGLWLALLDGSLFYFPLGLGIAVSGLLLLLRRGLGLAIYGIALIATLAWALYESGFDWWALSARGTLLVVLGILLLLPPMVRAQPPLGQPPAAYGASAWLLAVALLASGLIAGYSMLQTPHEIAGRFAPERMGQAADVDNDGVPPGEWRAYGRTAFGRRYSPLDQIKPENVENLKVAWTYRTGQIRGDDDPGETTYEVTPLVIGDSMYLCTPFATVIALDPTTGEERWRFDPQLKQPPTQTTQHMTCRGVSYSERTATPSEEIEPSADDGADAPAAESAASVTIEAAGVPQNVITGQAEPGAPNPQVEREEPAAGVATEERCLRRLFVPTSDGRLIAISAEDGRICPGFGGQDGTVNLWANMPNVTPGSAYSTSPPVVTDHLIIVGGTVNDNASATSPSGVIRAFDLETGALVWNFDIKRPEATVPIARGETYSENAPNSWSVSSYDPRLGLVYVPMGNQSPDQYGAGRSEAVERLSSSLVALDAESGAVRWVFQTVHHDLWDMDVPAQPSLIDLTLGGKRVPALVQPTKQGEIFVLNRRSGEPIFPVTETPAPQGAVEGDFTAPTQPVSAVSFGPARLREADMWGITPLDQLACRIAFRQLDYRGRYTPPSLEGTLVYPGNFGTFNWGWRRGRPAAPDPVRHARLSRLHFGARAAAGRYDPGGEQGGRAGVQ